MTGTGAFSWSDAFLVGFAPMDDVHHAFVEHVDALLACPDAEVLERLRAFARHAETHFGAELRWMQESAFPATQCHAGEHAAVLASVGDVMRLVEAGDAGIARRLAAALADWFPGHADHMDAGLARWLASPRPERPTSACGRAETER